MILRNAFATSLLLIAISSAMRHPLMPSTSCVYYPHTIVLGLGHYSIVVTLYGWKDLCNRSLETAILEYCGREVTFPTFIQRPRMSYNGRACVMKFERVVNPSTTYPKLDSSCVIKALDCIAQGRERPATCVRCSLIPQFIRVLLPSRSSSYYRLTF